MATDQSYAAFWRSLDPDTQEVIRRMDEHENLGHGQAGDISDAMIELLAKTYQRIDQVVTHLTGDPEAVEQHTETLLLILSFAPNAGAYWFIKELVYNQPDIYTHLYERVLNQKPLQMHGKLLKERLFFHLAREQIVNYIFSTENCLAVRVGLEGMQRG